MSPVKFSFVLVILLFLAPQFFIVAVSPQVSKDEAASALANSESVLVSAYDTVLEAEQAGANVSGLLVRLSDAGERFDKAGVAYRLGDFEATINLANNCSEIGNSVKLEADELRLEAYGPRYVELWFNLILSILGIIIVAFGSFWAWRTFKRRYYRRVLEMKPEVASSEP